MNCCELSEVTNSQYSGNSDRIPASVTSAYSKSMPGPNEYLVLDIGLQPAELNDRYHDGHHEQHDGLRAGQPVTAELERGRVDQLDNGDGRVVRAAAIGHHVDPLEDLEGGDGVDDDQIERRRP